MDAKPRHHPQARSPLPVGQQETEDRKRHRRLSDPRPPTPVSTEAEGTQKEGGPLSSFVSGTQHCGFWLLISTGAPGINLPGIRRDDCTFTSPLYQEVVLILSPCLSFLSHTANSHRLSILPMVMEVSMLGFPYNSPSPPLFL